MFSNNCGGANKKVESLKCELKRTNSTIFNLQETHFSQKGKVSIENFQIYEAIRQTEHGSMLGVHVSLQPVLVSEYSDLFEMIVVEIKSSKYIRLIVGYGPQENIPVDQRMPFFSTLEEEIVSAKMAGKSVLIQMDANSKLGKDIIPNDPKDQSPNGKVLEGIINRNGLIVVNSLKEKCEGLITRKRTTIDGIEESVIDFVIVSSDLISDLTKLVIDEKRHHALSKIVKGKPPKIIQSDHNVMLSTFKLTWNQNEDSEKETVFNLKNRECQLKFRKETSETNKLSKIFDTEDNIEKQTKKFLKGIKRVVHKCFSKVKVRKDKQSDYDKLYTKWMDVRFKEDDKSKSMSTDIENELSNKYSQIIFKKIQTEIDNIKYDEGGLNSGNLWKLKNKLNKKYPDDAPTAIKDDNGNLLTGKNEILNHTMNHFKKVLANRQINDDLTEHKQEREELAELRMKECKQNKTPDWTLEELEVVLKGLKNNKSRDALGYINEIFKPDVCGDDLKLAVLKLMNKIKEKQEFPKSLELCNITSIFKGKGEKNNLNHYRGVFRVLIFRAILEKLIYNDEYFTIDDNLTDANVGARKHRNICDNLFVVNAVLNSVKKGSEEALDLCAYIVKKCFNLLWTYECINNLYETGLKMTS